MHLKKFSFASSLSPEDSCILFPNEIDLILNQVVKCCVILVADCC